MTLIIVDNDLMFFYIGEEAAHKIKDADFTKRMIDESKTAGNRMDSFQSTFTKEVKDGFRELREEMKKKDK